MPGDADPADPTIRFRASLPDQTGGFVIVAAYGDEVDPGGVPFGVSNRSSSHRSSLPLQRRGGVMSLNVSLLRSSFELVVERQPRLVHRFYEILFERYPQVKPLFGRNSAAKQEEMLTGALVAVIDHLEDAPWLTNTLGELGKKHDGYGVTREMYNWVGASLLATLAEVAGKDWSPQLEGAWTEAYGAIVSLMNPAN
jgi:hemoglobin-like flavoprotein